MRAQKENGWIERGLSDDEIIDRINRFDPDMVALSIPFSCQHYIALHVAGVLKAINAKLPQYKFVMEGAADIAQETGLATG